MRRSTFLSLAAHVVLALADPTWPNPTIDTLEDYMYLQYGYQRFGLMDAVSPCAFAPEGNGRTAAAEWVRTAFHDFATFDAAKGIGGVDASIQYELNRTAENPGAAFGSTFGFFDGFYGRRASMADMIALGTHVAVRSCGGPLIPFRAGRVDATRAGASGVPEPQHDIATLTQAFKRAGFTTSEMIALTACGHTLGGIHQEDFPQITGPGEQAHFPKFDTTYAEFDNAVVTEYLSNTTTNPLVVGPKETRSDARVFGADGNVTMRALADPKTFTTTCSKLMQRMLDSVPKTVKLTDPVTPYAVKPTEMKLVLTTNGTLAFSGSIRVRTTGLTDNRAAVKLVYKRRDGTTCNECVISTTRPTYKDGMSYGFDENFAFYEFSTTLPASTSISSFNVVVQYGSSPAKTYTNNGLGYPVQDTVLALPAQSCLVQTDDGQGRWPLTVVAAVRNGASGTPAFELTVRTPQADSSVPALVLSKVAMTKGKAAPNGAPYTLWQATYALPITSWSTTFDLGMQSGGKSFTVLGQRTGSLSSDACKPLA